MPAVFFIILFIFFHNASTYAGFNYKPLLGSKWAQENPGVLPFSRCTISQEISMSNPEIWNEGQNTIAFGLGGGIERVLESYITCISERYGVAFQIPAILPVILDSFDFTVLVRGAPNLTLKLNEKSLNGQKVSNVFGTYIGCFARIGLLASCSARRLKNKHGLRIKTFTGEMSFIVSFGVGLSGFTLYKVGRIENRILLNPYVLTRGTQASSYSADTDFRKYSDDRVGIRIADDRVVPYLNGKFITQYDGNLGIATTKETVLANDGSTFISFYSLGFIGKTDESYFYHTTDERVGYRGTDEYRVDYDALDKYTFRFDGSLDK